MAQYLDNVQAVETALLGCPDPTAGRAIMLPAASASSGQHILRDAAGEPIDLAGYRLAADETPVVHRFLVADVFSPQGQVFAGTATIPEGGELGLVRFSIPTGVANTPGIYTAEIVIQNAEGDPVILDSTLLSIEPSLLSRLANPSQGEGPLTLGQVRMQLRDYPEANEYWRQMEYSPAEIVHSLIEPIRLWNETPPPVACFTGKNFPWRHHWLEAASANLLRIAANWYLRNSRRIKYADGTTEDDKEKAPEYLRVAELRWERYRQFCKEQKLAINLNTGHTSSGGYLRR